jgi:tetratricopeptide (TPR) repeat protein
MFNNSFCKNLLFILFLIGILMIPVLVFADADKIFKDNSKAVVVVVTYNEKGEPISQGSGFIVRPDGAVVTNYHVISNAKDIKVKAGAKVLDVEGLILADKENDIAILKAKGEKLQTVKIGDSEKATIGGKVYVISSPRGLENTISDGLLSGIREISSDKKVLQITAPVSPGSSGGPVFNKDGEVIGIATFLLEDAQNLNFAMPVNLIINKIGNKKVALLNESEIEDYKKTAGYWFNLGYAYGTSGKYKEAIESFQHLIRISPGDVGAHYNLGIVYGKLGKHKEAIESDKQAIRINPDYADAHLNLGSAYGKLGMYKEAIESYKQAVRINSDFAEPHYGLGLIYNFLDDRGSALEEYKILKDLDLEKANQLFNLIYK